MIFLEGKTINHVYHLADLHIRNLKRHKEYRIVLTKFLKNVKKDKLNDAIIYIGGDIAHAKTEMSPELVREISWFLTECSKLHPTFLITGNHDCFTGDHEVLTKSGWVTLEDYINSNSNVDVATFNINTSEVEFQQPTDTIMKPFVGNLLHIKGKDVDQLVTPTHNILHTYSQYPNKFYKKNAKDIKLRTPIPLNGIVSNYTPNVYAKLLGFSFADGTFVMRNENTGSGRVQFHLKKEREINYLCNILDELNYSYNIKHQSDGTVYINIYSSLAKDVIKFFNGIKEIPIHILNEDNSFHRSFIEGYLHGDGNKLKTNYWRFSSISKSSVDLLFTISRLSGFSSRLSDRVFFGNYENSKQQYGASCTDSNKVRNSLITEITTVDYNGIVYCLSVPNENLLIRHNNKISVSGNCNMNNPSRLDVLTPIVENLNNPNVHYLRDTDVHQIGNLTVGVFSIFSNKSEWPKGTDIEGEHKICFFHGPVDKSITDVGYNVSSKNFTLDMFDGYHICMLGDIHKRQVIQEYIPSLKKPIVVYASSMVQQNHGEFIQGHGYLLWDIPSRTFTEFDIHNDYGYMTIDVVNGEIPQWIYDELDTLPKYPKIRARFTDTDPSQVKLVLVKLKELFSATEITVTRSDTLGKLKGNHNLNSSVIGNVKDVEFQNGLIRDYLERHFMLSDSELDKIVEINNTVNNSISDRDSVGTVLWVPKTFEFSNMFSYGENNKIDFTKANGIVGVFAPNTSGKCVDKSTEVEVEFDTDYIISVLGFLPDELK